MAASRKLDQLSRRRGEAIRGFVAIREFLEEGFFLLLTEDEQKLFNSYIEEIITLRDNEVN